MNLPTIVFIGSGNMATAMIIGLLKQDDIRSNIVVIDHKQSNLERFSTALTEQQLSPDQCVLTTDYAAVEQADILIPSVKPQSTQALSESIKPYLKPSTALVSIAAGINCDTLTRWFGARPIVRSMPNTPSLVGCGATGYFSNAQVSSELKQQIKQILGAFGITVCVEKESLIDVVIAVSGSAPAYFLYFTEMMAETATKMGLPADDAQALAMQAFFGTGQLAKQSNDSLKVLRANVTSKGGTTHAAIEQLSKDSLETVIKQAMLRCQERAQDMTIELSSSPITK